jgi:hypothetical protein
MSRQDDQGGADTSLTHKAGTSSQCEPCRRGDEEHIKRHREIAEKIHELKQLRHGQTPASPLTPRSINAFSGPTIESPLTKKGRKIIKKAKKVSEMVKVVSSADIDFVSKVLHPADAEVDDLDIERQLVEDPDIYLNRFFHKGTSNTTEMRRAFVQKRKAGGKEETHVDPKELDGLLQLLNVSPLVSKSTAEERTIIADLRKKIEDDLIQEQHEKELMMMRKAGFWRWASKKAYKRLVQHGKIWGEKDSDNQSSRNDDTTTASSSNAVGGAGGESTEPDSDASLPSEDSVTKAMSTFKLDTPPTKSRIPRKVKEVKDGWTTVGKPGRVRTPTGSFKLVRNEGLTKVANSPSPGTHGFYSSVLGCDNEA